MACGKESDGACRWATVEVWLQEPAVVGGDCHVPPRTGRSASVAGRRASYAWRTAASRGL